MFHVRCCMISDDVRWITRFHVRFFVIHVRNVFRSLNITSWSAAFIGWITIQCSNMTVLNVMAENVPCNLNVRLSGMKLKKSSFSVKTSIMILITNLSSLNLNIMTLHPFSNISRRISQYKIYLFNIMYCFLCRLNFQPCWNLSTRQSLFTNHAHASHYLLNEMKLRKTLIFPDLEQTLDYIVESRIRLAFLFFFKCNEILVKPRKIKRSQIKVRTIFMEMLFRNYHISRLLCKSKRVRDFLCITFRTQVFASYCSDKANVSV